jgi:TolA-binding protein
MFNENKIEKELRELVRQFGGEPSEKKQKLMKIASQASKNQKQLQQSLDRLQESIDYLRVCIKYQLFDLEATKRENKYLKKLLQDSDNKD